jgi:hypothetical protein
MLDSIANAKTQTDIIKESEEKEKTVSLGFQMNKDVLVMRGGTVKAHVKDCCRILFNMVFKESPWKKDNFEKRVVNALQVKDHWIPLTRDGVAIKVPDDYFDKAVSIKDWKGDRSVLRRVLYIMQPTMEFTLQVLNDDKGEALVHQEDIQKIMTYGGVHGYGGERGDGRGRYEFNIEPLDKTRKNTRSSKELAVSK